MNKKTIFILVLLIAIFGVLISTSYAGWFGGNDFQTTASGTVFTVPNSDVKLLSEDDGVEVYGFEKNDAFYYAIVFNINEKPDLYTELSNTVCHGKLFEEDGVCFYEQEYQELGNSFDMWTGEHLVLKDKTVDGTFDKNNNTGEAIFVISSNYLYVVDSMKDIDWSS